MAARAHEGHKSFHDKSLPSVQQTANVANSSFHQHHLAPTTDIFVDNYSFSLFDTHLQFDCRLLPSPLPPPSRTGLKRFADDMLFQEYNKKHRGGKLDLWDIALYNRRLVEPGLVRFKLEKEWREAQHYNDYVDPNFVGKWEQANHEECKEKVETSNINGKVGFASMQGKRDSMEDAEIVSEFAIQIGEEARTIQLYGVFDGHVGAECSTYLKMHVEGHLKENLQKAFVSILQDEKKGEIFEEAAIFNVLKCAFVHLGSEYRMIHLKNTGKLARAGSAANIALTIGDDIWVSNVGDSRAILVSCEGPAIALSEDAKPQIPKYKRGAERRGGAVIQGVGGTSRVMGTGPLAYSLARAVGHDEETSGINPRAKVIKYSIPKEARKGSFLVIGCDGLWDIVSTNDVAATVRAHAHATPAEIAAILTKKAYQTGSLDNITVLVVAL